MKDFVRTNASLCAIIVFLGLYAIIIKFKPKLIFYEDGTIKDFGLGYKNKTILPIWLVAVVLAILSYIIVLYIGYLY
jgi:hypothetical protein